MSFLADPLLLLGAGATIERVAPDERSARRAEGLLLGTFLAMSVPVYWDVRWTTPIWRTFRARSGRDFMLNSGVLHFEYRDPPLRTHAVATGIFATYPLWLHLGRLLARRAGARRVHARTGRGSGAVPGPPAAAAVAS